MVDPGVYLYGQSVRRHLVFLAMQERRWVKSPVVVRIRWSSDNVGELGD